MEHEKEIERLRMQLVARGVVAMSNTPESADLNREIHPDYMSASCQGVMDAVDREMALRSQRDELARRVDGLLAALKDAKSVISSINSGEQHKTNSDEDDDPMYLQREEWVRWAIDEVLPSVEAAINTCNGDR